MNIESFRSIRAMGVKRWRAVDGQRPFTSFRWMAFGEQVYPNDTPVYHFMEAADGRSMAAVGFIRKNEPLPIAGPLIRSLVSLYLRRRPLLTCQVPAAGASGLLMDTSGAGRSEQIRLITEQMKTSLEDHNGSFLIFPYLSRDFARHAGWEKAFFTVTLPPGTVLPIRWHDFEEYIFSRKNSVRKDYRLHANRAERLGICTHIRSDLPDPAKAVQLIRHVEKRHRAAPNPAVRPMMEAAGTIGGRWLIVEQDGRMAGCGLLLEDRGALILTLLGLEPNAQQVYFALMYGAIRYAIENGIHTLYGGGGAYYFKSRLGHQLLENNYIKVYPAGRWLHELGARLADRERSGVSSQWPADTRAWRHILGMCGW